MKGVKIYFKDHTQELLLISDEDGICLGVFNFKALKRLKTFIKRSLPITLERLKEILKRDPKLEHYIYSKKEAQNDN